MKKTIYHKLLFMAMGAFIWVSCDKVKDLPVYKNGKAVVLSASATAITPLPADSNAVVVTFSWSSPEYATDTTNYKFIVQFDSSGRNFSKPFSKEVLGKLSASFTAKEINKLLVENGFAFDTNYGLDFRVISSYANNNEKYTSNVVALNFKTYLTPPKVPLPTSGKLYIVGDASTFSWTNPIPMPVEREFSKVSNTLYGGLFYMNGLGYYKLLQTPGTWSDQYHMLNGGNAFGGEFELRDAEPGFPSPNTPGWYKHTFDFQLGKFVVESFGNDAPQALYITGDAVPSSWTNSPPPSQQFTRVSSCEYVLNNVAFTPGKVFKLLSVNGQWSPQFGAGSAAGQLGANYGGGSDPDAISTPATAGNYKITVNFYTNTYKVEPM